MILHLEDKISETLTDHSWWRMLLPSHWASSHTWPCWLTQQTFWPPHIWGWYPELFETFCLYFKIHPSSSGGDPSIPLACPEFSLGLLPVGRASSRCPSHLICLLSIQKEQRFCFQPLKPLGKTHFGFGCPYLWSGTHWLLWGSDCTLTALPLIFAASLPQQTNAKSALVLMLPYSTSTNSWQQRQEDHRLQSFSVEIAEPWGEPKEACYTLVNVSLANIRRHLWVISHITGWRP